MIDYIVYFFIAVVAFVVIANIAGFAFGLITGIEQVRYLKEICQGDIEKEKYIVQREKEYRKNPKAVRMAFMERVREFAKDYDEMLNKQ